MAYKVKYGDTIFDVLLNVCGDYSQIDEILSLNGLLSYTPQLTVGQELDVEGLQTSNNATLIRASEFPYNSNLLSEEELDIQIEQIIDSIEGGYFMEVQPNYTNVPQNGDSQYINIYTNSTFNVL